MYKLHKHCGSVGNGQIHPPDDDDSIKVQCLFMKPNLAIQKTSIEKGHALELMLTSKILRKHLCNIQSIYASGLLAKGKLQENGCISCRHRCFCPHVHIWLV